MRFARIGLLAWLSAFGAGPAAAAFSEDGPCAAAMAVADHILASDHQSRPLVFEEMAGEKDRVRYTRAHWYQTGEESAGMPPDRALFRRWAETAHRDAPAHCPTLRVMLERAGAGLGREARENGVRVQEDGLFFAAIHAIELPVLSIDGRHALVEWRGVSGPLAGGGFLDHLERQPDGTWVIVGRLNLWIS